MAIGFPLKAGLDLRYQDVYLTANIGRYHLNGSSYIDSTRCVLYLRTIKMAGQLHSGLALMPFKRAWL
jgi:hypothetical protein